ncbi:MAG: zinc ribbon domain-containing protein [Lachnospiraceae bacterium]|nr:zinc ribbon domain-containing protein [Lachnospiraceae bacterium]
MHCPKCGEKIPRGSLFCSECGADLKNASYRSEVDDNESGNKRNRHKIAAVACALLSGLALMAFAAFALAMRSADPCVYLSQGTYKLIKDLDREEVIEIPSAGSATDTWNMLVFTSDGKYIYYLTNYCTGSGTLCRAKYKNLKKDSRKIDKYIEVLATDVLPGFKCIDDNGLLYETGDHRLCLINGDEQTDIDEDIEYYSTDGENRIIYISGKDLKGVSFNDPENKIILATGVDYIYDSKDFENILYFSSGDEVERTLNVAGFSKENRELTDHCYDIAMVGDKVYYTVRDSEINLYDYVIDDYAGSDAVIEEPKEEDYSIPEYSYEMIGGTDLNESDSDDLYTTCIDRLYWYGESTWWSYSMEEALDRNWGIHTEDVRNATKSFIDRFSSMANEDGYIPVTDEVKAALKEIVKAGEAPEEEWIWLCYNRYLSGMITDSDAYQAAYDKWNAVRNRNSLRDLLKSAEGNYPVKSLYCYEDGDSRLIKDGVLTVESYSGGLIFNTVDMIREKISLDEINSVYDVYSLFGLFNTAEDYIITGSGKLSRMSPGASERMAELYNSGCYVNLYFTDKEIYMSDEYDVLSMAKISNGVAGSFKMISDDARPWAIKDGIMYYSSDNVEKYGDTVCDLYRSEHGRLECVAGDIAADMFELYEDGRIIAYLGDGNGLVVVDTKGNETVINGHVSQYARLDRDMIMYISGGDLFLFDGKESRPITSGVTRFWVKEQMDSEIIW